MKSIDSVEFDKLISSDKFKVEYDVKSSLKKEGLKYKDFVEICKRLDRPPNRTELGMFGVMWSEHCCYRNSRSLLRNFPTEGPRILVGPGENAGVVDIGDGQKLVFKIESHNHPSAIEPFQGAATGVGGILRDIFTMGARPIAILNALRFGPLDSKKNTSLLSGVVSGIAHYGNCVGVPTVGGEVSFDESYSGNPLVNAMALGLMETDHIVKSGAEGIGYSVVYVGNTTGRDGMGGASFASSELTDSSFEDRPAVQVGDPFFEKGLIEACLESFKEGDVIAAQDMGAAGLTCSSSEMAANGGVGIELNLDLVPAREKNMTAYEFLLSESQERMLFVVKPGYEETLMKRFQKWGLYASVVGKVVKEKVVRILHKNSIVANIPASALADDTPIENHTLLKEPPDFIKSHWLWNEKQLNESNSYGIIDKDNHQISWNEALIRLLDNPSIASKKWIYNQYDYQVQANTLHGPGVSDAAIIRLRPQQGNDSTKKTLKGIAAVVDCPNRWVYLDPERGSILAVSEAARNLSAVGALPIAITDNLNFSSPENDIGYWQLASSCRGISTACKAFKTPVTGGNVSLYNETKINNNNTLPIQPTPIIGMVGILEDISNIPTISWKHNNDVIALVGLPLESNNKLDERLTLSGTSYLEYIHGKITGRPPIVDFDFEIHVQKFMQALVSKSLLSSSHDVSKGGIALALSECSIGTNFGAQICLNYCESIRIDRTLFAEGGPRFLISTSNQKYKNIIDNLQSFNESNKEKIYITKLGKVVNEKRLIIGNENKKLIDLSISDLQSCYENAIPRRMEK